MIYRVTVESFPEINPPAKPGPEDKPMKKVGFVFPLELIVQSPFGLNIVLGQICQHLDLASFQGVPGQPPADGPDKSKIIIASPAQVPPKN